MPLLTEHEVALRLARNKEVDRKLRMASRSPFFWFYSLSLWDPDAFWRCVSGAVGVSMVGFILIETTPARFALIPLTATTMFECFLLGLILMWTYHLGAWLHPVNFRVILTFIFQLYRKNKTLDDLSAREIDQLFTSQIERSKLGLTDLLKPSAIPAWLRSSPALGPLLVGVSFATFLVLLLHVAS
jgi:hypothetical protein